MGDRTRLIAAIGIGVGVGGAIAGLLFAGTHLRIVPHPLSASLFVAAACGVLAAIQYWTRRPFTLSRLGAAGFIGIGFGSLLMSFEPERSVGPPAPNGLPGLWNGKASVSIAQTMTVDRAYPVVLGVSGAKDFDLVALRAAMGTSDAPEVRSVVVADVMVARLSGEPLSAFDVRPDRQEQKGIGKDGLVRWSWEVTPRMTGVQRLVLELDAVVRVDNSPDAPRTIHRQFIPIDVMVVPWYEAAYAWIVRLATGEWLWSQIGTVLLGGISTALAAFAALRWRRIVEWWKRRNTPPPLEK